MELPAALAATAAALAEAALPARLFGDSSVSTCGVMRSVDCHCAGLPARVLVSGAPDCPGNSAMERRSLLFSASPQILRVLGRQYMMSNLDWLRTLMITETRGYPCQNLDVIFPPTPACPEAAFSFVVAENNFVYPLMSGHNTICVVTALLETNMVPMVEPVTEFVLEAPAGPIKITAECKDGKCISVTFVNTPSFALEADLGVEIEVPGGVGKVTVDVSYGGMWYAIVDGPSIGLSVVPEEAAEIVRLGEMIKVACREQHPVQHPTLDYPGCDILCIRGPASEKGKALHGVTSRNAVVMSTGVLDWGNSSTWKGNIDRSPCGSGTSAVMAAMYAKGELGLNEDFVHESILGTIFVGRLLEEVDISSGIKAVVPSIQGQAWITQHSEIVVDPTDPLGRDGYTLGDIWASSTIAS